MESPFCKYESVHLGECAEDQGKERRYVVLDDDDWVDEGNESAFDKLQ
jgi:hypothetical protein